MQGIWGTRRIVVNENLIKQCSPAEIEAALGHEIGHCVLGHTLQLIVFRALLILFTFGFVHWSGTRLLGRWGQRWGVRGITDVAGLPLGIALYSAFTLLIAPVDRSFLRSIEAEADLFGLNAARQPDAFATVALKLAEFRKLDPGPMEEMLLFDHPSGRSRIRMAMRWKAATFSTGSVISPQP